MFINSNLSATNVNRNLKSNNYKMNKTMEKLSSGYRINRAADDAAGLAISEKIKYQINGTHQAARNVQDGISLIQTAEGGMNEIHAMLQRMNVLANQAANGTYSNEDRAKLELEFIQLQNEIDNIAENTNFNGITLLDGNLSSMIQSGVNSNESLDISVNDISIKSLFGKHGSSLGITGGSATSGIPNGEYNVTLTKTSPTDFNMHLKGWVFDLGGPVSSSDSSKSFYRVDGITSVLTIDYNFSELEEGSVNVVVKNGNVSVYKPSNVSISSQDSAENAINSISNAIDYVSTERAKLGAYQNRLEHTLNNLHNSAENLSAAHSRIRDADMASEITELTRNQILVQAGTSMLAQANAIPQNILKLLG